MARTHVQLKWISAKEKRNGGISKFSHNPSKNFLSRPVVLESYESKTTDKREQYDWRAVKKLDMKAEQLSRFLNRFLMV